MDKAHTIAPGAQRLWQTRYQWVEPGHIREPSLEASWERVALAVSGVEPHHRDPWRERFRRVLEDHSFVPASQILATAGTRRHASLLTWYGLGAVEDSVQGIFNALRESMVTLQGGAGIRLDFSLLRPTGVAAVSTGGASSGPVSFMSLWTVGHAVMAAGHENLAPMAATLRCDHPDIEKFIAPTGAIETPSNFSRTVLITDAFMHAVQDNAPWPLVFPESAHGSKDGVEMCERVWTPGTDAQTCRVHRRVGASALWERLLEAIQANASVRLEFVDRVQRGDNLWYSPQTPWGAVACGAINLARCVRPLPSGHWAVDFEKLKGLAAVATRFLDNVHDLSLHPLKTQEKTAHATRRIGLGVTGLAALLSQLRLPYGSPHSLKLVHEVMRAVRDTAYQTSVEIAREKGAFPAFDATAFAAGAQVLDLPHALQDDIAKHRIRNSELLRLEPDTAMDFLSGVTGHGIAPDRDTEPAARAEDQLNLANIVQSYTDGLVEVELTLPANSRTEAIALLLWQVWESKLKSCRVRLLPVRAPALTH